MKNYLLYVVMLFVINGFLIYYSIINPITFTQKNQRPEETMQKYEEIWDDTTIVQKPYAPKAYKLGDIIGSITIPSLDIYEMPIYYGTTDENKNWQITTPGYEGNWQLFGEYGMTAIGAHNYQMFNELPSVTVGEKIIVETTDDIYVYEMSDKTVFNHETDDWNNTVYTGKAAYSISLLTCYPVDMPDTDDRYIVYAELQRGTIFSDKKRESSQ